MTIARDGGVSIQIQGEPLPIEIARLGIYQFNDPQQLVREANGRFRSDTMEPIAVENARVEQFSIENSNINPIQEIVELLELSRAYTQVASASNDIHEQKKDSIKRLGTNT
ncbi:MAG: flagellar basal body rod C-terminal domain-containing protein [Pseudomonadota bacterium]